MISAVKLKELSRARKVTTEELAGYLLRRGLDRNEAVAAVNNWQKGLYKPRPQKNDIQKLANALSVEVNDLLNWQSSYHYAPISARKARLVTQLIVGRSAQDAMDILKFTRKRAASMVNKVLKTAVADADEQQADVDNLYVSEARVDDAGVRIGTKRWVPKDRGKMYPIRQRACHIYVTVTQV
jgi:large subunit ribosomal protein L22